MDRDDKGMEWDGVGSGDEGKGDERGREGREERKGRREDGEGGERGEKDME